MLRLKRVRVSFIGKWGKVFWRRCSGWFYLLSFKVVCWRGWFGFRELVCEVGGRGLVMRRLGL